MRTGLSRRTMEREENEQPVSAFESLDVDDNWYFHHMQPVGIEKSGMMLRDNHTRFTSRRL